MFTNYEHRIFFLYTFAPNFDDYRMKSVSFLEGKCHLYSFCVKV